MFRKGISGDKYRPLSDNDVREIHDTAVEILEQVGFTFESGLEDTLDMLQSAGARVDREKSRIYFPPDLVEEQIAKAPGKVLLYSRDGKNDLRLGGDRVHLGTGGAAINILDLDTDRKRSTTLKDLYLIGRLIDKLDNIHFFLRPCVPQDVALDVWDENIYYTCFKATAKHVMGGVNSVEGLQKVADIAAAIAGSREAFTAKPFVSVITSFAISPLKLCTQSTKIMQEACRLRIPVALSSAPAAGTTSPMTMAGTLAQLHAEEMVGITIGQLTSPGAPQLYGGIPGAADMSTMGYMGGAVECGMMNAAIHQLARYIGVPNYNSSGLSDSKLPDAQAGWEKALTTLLVSMSGSNYIHHAAGMLESMLSVAYEQYVIDDEIIGMCLKVLEGITVDKEHLAFDAIKAAGPGGNFMMSDHTLEYMRKEFFNGNGVSDKYGRDRWEDEGSLDARKRGKKIARKLIAENDSVYIPEETDRELRSRYQILLPEHV